MATATSTVWAYDETGNRRVQYEVAIGDEVAWKRNGTVGAFRCRILGFSESRVQVQPLWWDGRPLDDARPVWVKPRFLRVYPTRQAMA